MNTNLRAGFLVLLFLCVTSWLSAQKSTVTELLTRADRQFDLYSYNLAAQTYEEVLKEEKSNGHALARIGDCNFQLNRPEKAVEWYQKAQNTSNMESDVPLRLGKALMLTSDYSEARDQFLLYAETDERVGRHFADLASYAIKNAKNDSQWLVKNEAINTTAADYGAAFYYSKVAFNSARTDIVPTGKPALDAQGGNTNFLFVSQRNSESKLLQKPTFLRADIQNNRNEGPISFSANGHRVAFCRNKFISGTRQIAETGMNMSIYIADVEDGNWKNVKAFTYNGSNYATGFPCLSPDGNKLIFASTQPGGFGGWDIYVSNWTASGWSEPRNLGTPLNTPGNEVTPYFDGQDLYFASDWHNGFGGLDVFQASLGEDQVGEVINMGPGVNSPRDDYGFIYNSNDNIGYLTSTRSGGRGNEDIWMVSKKWNDNDLTDRSTGKSAIARSAVQSPTEYSTPGNDTQTDKVNSAERLHLLVTDERGFALSDVAVDLTACYGNKGFSGADGKFFFDELLRPIECSVSLRKKGYKDATIALHEFGKQNIKIALELDNQETFRGYVFDSRTNVPIRGVTVQVQNGDNVLEATTNEAGFYSLTLEPGLTYLVSYNKNGYTDAIIRTNFPFNSNNRIANVTMEKSVVERPSSIDKKDTDYVEYSTTEKPIVYSTTEKPVVYSAQSVTPISKVYTRETTKTTEPNKFNGYSIQLAAMPEEPSDARLGFYEPLIKIANLYVKSEDKLNKIRLGIFTSQAEANENLKKVLKDKNYKGAWVVEERGGDESLMVGNVPPAVVQYNSVAPLSTSSNDGVRYAIQVGSFPASKPVSISEYSRLNGLGNLYSSVQNGYTKVRLGVWSNHTEAETTRKEVLRRGYSDAIIITELANDPNIRDYLLSAPTPIAAPKVVDPKGEMAPAPVVYSTTTPTPNSAPKPYYIRIAALSRPDDFDPYPLEGMGTIEKRQALNSPGMTIILLGSYSDLETAKNLTKNLIGMGYKDAYVVKDEKGKLIRKD